MKTTWERRLEIQARRKALIAYLESAVVEEDWHAVSDAANDLRCADVELRVLCESTVDKTAT
jgi:hypothetical protein